MFPDNTNYPFIQHTQIYRKIIVVVFYLLSDALGDLQVLGGEFTGCRSTGNGAFMFASDGARVTIKDATVTDGVAERRAGVVSSWIDTQTDRQTAAIAVMLLLNTFGVHIIPEKIGGGNGGK